MLLSPSSQRAWIEISRGRVDLLMLLSPSSQRAWIEIPPVPAHTPPRWVALLAEGVDRNFERPGGFVDVIVALLAEGVDRNRLN